MTKKSHLCWVANCIVFFVGFVVLLGISCGSAVAAPVLVKDGKLTLSFKNEPLKSALHKVGVATGIEFMLDGNLSGTIYAKYRDVSVEEGLRRMLRKYNHAMFFGPDGKGGYKVMSVKVFRKGRQATANYSVLGARGKVSARDAGGAVSVGAGLLSGNLKDGHSQADGSQSRQVNPFGAGSRGKMLQEIIQTRKSLAMLQRKAAAETGVLQEKIAQKKRMLAGGEGDQEALSQIKLLEGQLQRSKQNNAMMMINEQKNMETLQKNLGDAKNPSQLSNEAVARANRQAGGGRRSTPQPSSSVGLKGTQGEKAEF